MSANWWPSCPGGDELTRYLQMTSYNIVVVKLVKFASKPSSEPMLIAKQWGPVAFKWWR